MFLANPSHPHKINLQEKCKYYSVNCHFADKETYIQEIIQRGTSGTLDEELD